MKLKHLLIAFAVFALAFLGVAGVAYAAPLPFFGEGFMPALSWTTGLGFAAGAGIVSFASQSFTPDRLIAGPSDELRSRQVTQLTGQNLTRGTVLGKITMGAASAAAKGGGNTGNGTITMDATTPIRANAQPGIYTVRNISAVVNGGVFVVIAPDGRQIGNPAITIGAGGTGAFDDQIKFVLTDGATDFALGDGFDVTIAAGSGKYIKSLAAAIDGSQVPDLILAEDTDATSADKVTVAYYSGDFNENSITLGAGHTADSVREGLRIKLINLVKPLGA